MSAIALVLFLATTSEPPHFDFGWLTWKGPQLRMEFAEQPGTKRFDLDEEGATSLTFQTAKEPEIKGTVEGDLLVATPKEPADIACLYGEFGFSLDHRDQSKDVFTYVHAKAVRTKSALTKVFGMDTEIYLKQVDGEWTARVRHGGKDTSDFSMFQFFKRPEDALTFRSGSLAVSLGRNLPEPLWLAAFVYEDKAGSFSTYTYDRIQHAATLTFSAGD